MPNVYNFEVIVEASQLNTCARNWLSYNNEKISLCPTFSVGDRQKITDLWI